MESLGERLRKAREEKSFSRDDIAEATKISDRRLEDLENDRFELLPPPVFVKGFIRAYCRHVDLDEKELVRVYEEALKSKGLGHPEQKLGREKKSAGGIYLALALTAVVIALAYYWHSSPAPREVPAPSVVTEQPLKESEILPAPPEIEEPRQEEPAPPPVPVAQPVAMVVKCHSTTWLEVTIDNGLPTEVTLVPGDEINWEGKERIELSLGNAGGVSLRVNGMQLRPFGKPKEVVGLVFEGNTVSVRGKPAQSLAEWQEPGTEVTPRQEE